MSLFSSSPLFSRPRYSVGVLTLLLLAAAVGCRTEKSSGSKKGPAKLEHPSEGDIYRVVLTPKAVERLQITTSAVEKRAMPKTRTVGATVMIPDGASVTVTSPVTGTLKHPTNSSAVVAGNQVKNAQIVFRLTPLLAPEREVPSAAERVSMANAKASLLTAQIIADGDVEQGEAQLEAAQIALTRATKLFSDKVGSQRDVDDAQARFDLAQKSLEAANQRKQQLNQLSFEADSVVAEDVLVFSPQDGMLRNITSSVDQVVSVGAPLFEVVDLDTMWVRVPVYPGLTVEIDSEREARIQRLGRQSSAVSVKRISAPPSGDFLASSVDLFYELNNADHSFAPNEPIQIVLPLKGEAQSLVVPRAAILRDIHGIAWVYIRSAENEFRRHRVEVEFTTEEHSILSAGPDVGTDVVVDGAAELFGTEFGAGK